MTSRPVQIAACDSRSATLFTGTMELPARLRLHEHSVIPNTWRDVHEHQRPSKLGMGANKGAHQSVAGFGHESEELMRRFARDVAIWIDSIARKSPEIPTLVFVAPKFLGFLREQLAHLHAPSNPTLRNIELCRGEICGLRAGEVAAHPTVRTLAAALCKPEAPLVHTEVARLTAVASAKVD